jgi:hypothetical protein
MEFNEARNKLRRMTKDVLFELASKQEISRCVIGDEMCGLYFRYEGFGFCISEILGQGCQVQRTKTLENRDKNLEVTVLGSIFLPCPTHHSCSSCHSGKGFPMNVGLEKITDETSEGRMES